MNSDDKIPGTKRYLNANYLAKTFKHWLEDVTDKRRAASLTYPVVDTLIAAFAMFSLKEPSLLSYVALSKRLLIALANRKRNIRYA